MSLCPSDETLGALVNRALDDGEAAHVKSHLDDCAACRQVMIAVVRGGLVAAPKTFAPSRAERSGSWAVGTPSHGSGVATPATLSRRAARIGARVGRYEIRGLLGTGGMGEVYDAYDAELERPLALKLMRPELAGPAGVLAERLVRESRMMAKVVHPAVITVFDVGRVEDTVFIAMERVRGETLGQYRLRMQPSWSDAIALLEQAGHGLASAHAAGIVHRDFKPENVLVELDGDRVTRVVVTDFGVARASGGEDIEVGAALITTARESDGVRLTVTGAVIGTPAYMAPEQLAGERADLRADVFAFAVSAWEAVFGERPFPGRTVDEIRAAFLKPPRPPPKGRGLVGLSADRHVPHRLVRALERGLAIEPDERWPDMPAFLRELASIRTRRRAAWIAAASVVALLGLGLGGTRALAAGGTPDPCERATQPFARAIDEPRRAAIAAHLAARPKLAGAVITRLDTQVRVWRDTLAATCRADAEPAQPATVAACLDARRLEIAAFVDEVLDGGDAPRYAHRAIGVIEDPGACAHPAPGLLEARVPADRETQRRVAAIRYRAYDVEAARDRSDFAAATVSARSIVADAAKTWPPLHAEALYLLGSVQSMGGDNKQGIETLRQAATLAERVHHDHIAANSWIQLVFSMSEDLGEPARALEYVNYADAALERIGRPPEIATLFEYARGATLIQVDRTAEGEVALRRALDLAENNAPQYLPEVIQGLAFLYQRQGRYADAVDTYRRALVHMSSREQSPSEVITRAQLAISLGLVGRSREAVAEARRAAALADRVLGADNIDRSVSHVDLAQVLQNDGQLDEALAEAERGGAGVIAVVGERNERYGEVLSLEGSILTDLGRFREADARFVRGCEILGFRLQEGSSSQADCWQGHANAKSGLGDHRGALALIERALPQLRAAHGDDHAETATAYAARGEIRAALGQHAGAIEDYEKARAILVRSSLDLGHVAAVELALVKEVAKRDPARARELVAAATAHLEHASNGFAKTRRELDAWLASRDGKAIAK